MAKPKQSKHPKYKVGRYQVTEPFTRRARGFYDHRIRKGLMPSEIIGDLLDGGYAKGVSDKTDYGLNKLGQLAGIPRGMDALTENDRDEQLELHAAFQRWLQHFGLPGTAEPNLPKPDESEEPEQQEQPTPDEDGDDGDDGEPEDDGDGDDGDGDDGDEQGDESDGDGDGDESEDSDSESESGDDGDTDSGGKGQGDGDGDGDGEGDDSGDGDGEGDDSGDGDGGGDGDSESDGQGENESEGDGQSNGSSTGQRKSPQSSKPRDLDMDKERASLSNLSFLNFPEPEPTQLHRYGQFSPHRTTVDLGSENQLMAKLKQEIMSVSQRRKYGNRDDGILDVEDKCSDIANSCNIEQAYYTLTQTRRMNTAVQIMVDVSASMKHSGLDVQAAALLYLLASTLQRLRVPTQIVTFGDYASLVKDWHEPADEKLLTLHADSQNTNLPTCIGATIDSLNSRRETRKLLLILCDGDVGFTTVEAWNHAKATLNQARDAYSAAQRRYQSTYDNSDRLAMNIAEGACSLTGKIAGLAAKNVTENEESFRSFFAKYPQIETYAFGLGVFIHPSLFTRAVSNLTPANMIETITQELGTALVMNPHQRTARR